MGYHRGTFYEVRQYGLYPEQVAAWKAVFEAVGQDDVLANSTSRVTRASRFAGLTAARDLGQKFTAWYNTKHRHNAIRSATQLQRHTGEDQFIQRQHKPASPASYLLANN